MQQNLLGQRHEQQEKQRHSQSTEPVYNLAPVFADVTEGAPVHPPDLSTRGMFINTDDELPIGAILNLQFRLALSEAEVIVRAEVRHRIPHVGVGIEFIDLSTAARRAIEREIELSYPPLLPRPWTGKRSVA